MARATILKVRAVLTGIAKNRIIAKRGEGGCASAVVELMGDGDRASAIFEEAAVELLVV